MAESGRLPAVKVGRQWRFPEDRLREWLGAGEASPDRDAGDADLRSLLSPGSIQAVSDLLGDTLGAMFLLTDLDGRPLAAPSNPCGLFEALHRYPGVLERCITGWQTLAAEPDLGTQWRVTPLGFLCARSLVRDGGRLIGMVLAGGIAPAAWPPDEAEVTRLAADLGVPPAVIRQHADQVHRLDSGEQDRVLRLLPRIAAFLSRLAAEHSQLAGRLEAIAALAAESPQRSET